MSEITFTQGKARVHTVELVVNGPDFRVWEVDFHSKRPHPDLFGRLGSQGQVDVWGVEFAAITREQADQYDLSETLDVDESADRETRFEIRLPQEVDFEGHHRPWHVSVDGARYCYYIIAWRRTSLI